MSEFETYLKLKSAGIEPRGIYLKAKENGLNSIVATRMLREVFGFTFMEAKSEWSEEEAENLFREIGDNVPCPRADIQDYVFHSDDESDAEVIVDRMLSYKPIQL